MIQRFFPTFDGLLKAGFITCVLLCVLNVAHAAPREPYIPSQDELADGDVQIIAGEDKTVYEYWVAGRLMMIKVSPKGLPSYYMVPADGSAHFESLDHQKKLYPQWVLIEF